MNTAYPGTAVPARARSIRHVIATTDVHSSLDRAEVLVRTLRELRAQGALIADCGDFFEGTGYYVLDHGRTETALLRGLYDVAAPGNHGYRHHVTDPGLRAMTVCANVTDHAGTPAWQPLIMAEVRGCATAVTAVLGVEAFMSVPPAERRAHHVHDPATALLAVHDRYRGAADSWIVLSHSGFEHDMLLARACPFIDVIFAGHCHSPRQGPQAAGSAVVVKGGELAGGYAAAWPCGTRWHAGTWRFPDGDPARAAGDVPADLEQALARVAGLRTRLARVLGPIRPRFAFRTTPMRELLACLADAACAVTGAGAALLNLTCLREIPLSGVLTAGDLMTLEPFGNTLACVRVPDAGILAGRLSQQAGPLVTAPSPLPPPGCRATVATTDYLASTHLPGAAGHACGSAVRLRDMLAGVLLDSGAPDEPRGELR